MGDSKEMAQIRKIFDAVRSGDKKKVESLLNKNTVDTLNEKQSLLHFAVELNYIEIVQLLINKGAKLDILDKDGATPLHYCSKTGNTIIAKMLIDKGAHISALDNQTASPLHWACQKGQLEITKLLVQCGAPMDVKAKLGVTPLHAAVSASQSQIVLYLATMKASLDTKIANGSSPLHIAVKKGNIDISRILLKYRCNPNAVTNGRYTSLHLACNEGNKQMVQLLLFCGADATIRDKDGLSPSDLATQRDYGHLANFIKKATFPVFEKLTDSIVSYLLTFLTRYNDLRSFALTSSRMYYCTQPAWESLCKRFNCKMQSNLRKVTSSWSVHHSLVRQILANYELQFEQGENALLREIQRIGQPNLQPVHINPIQSSIALVEHGVDPNTIHKSGISVIHMALLKGANDLVHLLAERGANINHQKPNGNSPLHDLAGFGRDKLCGWIVKLGADPNLPNGIGDTPLIIAAKKRQWKIVFLLCSLKADINSLNMNSENVLHIAVEGNSSIGIVQRLIDENVNIDQNGFAGNTALHYAAKAGYYEISKVLLEQGANPNITNSGGSTPLHIACFNNNFELVKLLLQYKADPNIKNNDSHTVYYFARLLGHKEILNFFESIYSVRISRNEGFHLVFTNER